MPNLYFTRDPFAMIGNGVSINSMYSETRNRETIYGEYIFTHHPLLKGTPEYLSLIHISDRHAAEVRTEASSTIRVKWKSTNPTNRHSFVRRCRKSIVSHHIRNGTPLRCMHPITCGLTRL